MSNSQYVINTSQALGTTIHDYLVTQGINTITASNLATQIESYYDSLQRSQVELSAVQPDIRQIVEQLQQQLSTRDSWKDTITASTGQMLIDFLAGVGAFNQLGIERAVFETMLKTAVLKSSVIVMARDLGVHVTRKVPAGVTVTLNNSDTSTIYSIPPYTQFSINGTDFFNRTTITFNVGVSQLTGIVLNQGTVVSQIIDSTGELFSRYEIGNEDFSVSDIDILCLVDTQTYSRVIDGLWHYEGTAGVFFENTLPNGNVEIIFGNNVYGASPKIGSQLTFTYATTSGVSGNNAITGQAVVVGSFPTITGSTTSAMAGGADEQDIKFYKTLAASMYSSRDRAVTRRDHKAIGMQYPGILDILFLGQAETFPADKNYMNVVQVTPFMINPTTQWVQGLVIAGAGVNVTNVGILYVSTGAGTTGATPPTHTAGTVSDGAVSWTFVGFTPNKQVTTSQFNDIVAYIKGEPPYTKQFSIYNMQYIQQNPTFVNKTITATLYCSPDSQLTNLKNYIVANIKSALTPGVGSIGKSLPLSDINTLLKVAHPTYGKVDWYDLTSPATDTVAGALDLILINPTITLTMNYSTRLDT